MGDRVSRLADTRTTMAQAIRDGMGPDFPAWRVHDVPPETVAAPCVWVDVPSLRVDDGGRGLATVVSTWPVILLVDGADPAQVEALDRLLPFVWDAVDSLPMTVAVAASATPFDVGGPRTRGVSLTADATHYAKSFCQPVPRLAETASP